MTAQTDDRAARAAETSARFRAAVEAGDLDAFVETLAPDVVLVSPITSRFRFEGREEVRHVLGVALETIEDIRYCDDVGDERVRALQYTARIGRQEIGEATFLRLDDEGRVREIRLFVRPLPGLMAMMAAIGTGLAARHGRGRARVVRALTAPLVAIVRLADRLSLRLVPLRPPRGAHFRRSRPPTV